MDINNYTIEWVIRGTTTIPASSPEEAEEKARHKGYSELAFIGNTGVPTVTSFEARVQGAPLPTTIVVTELGGSEWSAQAGSIAKRGGNPWAAVINLVEAHPEVLE